MRDSSDMMEDALSEDTLMDCGVDGGGLEDLVDLATDVADSSSTIRGAAERLLTLLGVDDENDILLSSSEDEGVELDVDELDDDEDDEDDERENTRLLHQLAASLAKELKYSQEKQHGNTGRLPGGRSLFDIRDQVESMEMSQDTSYLEHSCLHNQDYKGTTGYYRANNFPNSNQHHNELKQGFGSAPHNFWLKNSMVTKDVPSEISVDCSGLSCLDRRLRMFDLEESDEARSFGQEVRETDHVPASWRAGWDACATEALRYLIEEEGLPPHHPTVLAIKDHLDLQRGRAFAQYTA